MALNRLTEDQVKQAIENKKKEQSEKNQTFYQRNFDDIHYTALEVDKLKFVRVVGVPIEFREKHDPFYSPKIVFLSWITDDNGKKMRVIWPSRTENRDWPLYKIMNKLLSYEYSRENDSRIYHYRNSKPKLFYRVLKNKILRPQDIANNGGITEECEKSLNPYESGWYYGKFVVMNVIDREFMDWHKENKHTMLLSKKASSRTLPDGTTAYNYEPGVPKTVYDLLTGEDIMAVYHDFLDYDVIIKKLDDQPWYKMWHPEEEKKFISSFNSKENFIEKYPFYNPEIHLRPLTDEEKSWDRYNVDQLFKVTSYQKIRNRLGDFIKEFDKEFNTSVFEEVDFLAKKEREKYNNDEDSEDNKKENQTSKVIENKPMNERKEPQTSNDLPVRVRSSVKEEVEENSFNLEAFKESGFEGIDKLLDAEKSMIIGFDEEKGTFIYHTDEEIYKCINSKKEDNPCLMQAPESFQYCPKCGIKF